MRQRVEPGEWKVDEFGQHFRRVGNSIEYMPTITTTYGEFEVDSVPPPPSDIEPTHPKSWGECPFVSKCTPQCAMYGETGCGIVTGETPTIGKRCPFSDKRNIFSCTEKCALWALCSKEVKANAGK